jgi:uncharacterized protein (DUF433 family)
MTSITIPERLTRPIYSFSEADHLAGASRGTARRWIRGYNYLRDGKRIERPPVTLRKSDDTPAASFFDLLEVVVIGRMKSVGLSLNDVREVVKNCQEIFGYVRPLVQARFKSDGRDIFVEQGDRLIEVGRRKRMMAWNDVLEPFLEELHYTGDWADRWFPLGKGNPIVIDPEYAFGLPVIDGSGVRTEIVIERVRAGDLPEDIAADFNLTPIEVFRAIQYESTRAA